MLLLPFSSISKHDAATAGGKGASLGEMTQAGIPVPPGYVILADAFEQFIAETKLKSEIDSILHRVKKEEMESVERASEEIQALILSAKMPKDIANEIKKHFKELNAEFVAVRSSATAEDSSAAAWAGQLDTFLNTTEKTLLQNVQKCWASLFTPRAIFYRFEKGLHKTHISVAVVVQKMVQSEISGIAFSVHPVTQDYNQMIIEGGFGLGEAIVSGQVTPDSYVLEKKPFAIIEKNVSTQTRGIYRLPQGGSEWKDIPSSEGEKQKLSEKQIHELGKLILRIESHYGFPVDVEWAFEKGKFYITQSRPITTLMKKSEVALDKTNLPIAPRIFSRDFSIAAIQIATRCESISKKPWTTHGRKYSPHIIGWRTDGTIHWYYHPTSWGWMNQELIAQCQKNKKFLQKVEENVKKGIQDMRPIYESEKTLSISQLQRFIRDYIDAYPWIEAMWILYRMDAKELGADNSNIKKLRVLTDKLSAGADVVIRKSLMKAYPQLGKWSAFMTLDEVLQGKIPSVTVLQQRDAGFMQVDDALHVGMTPQELIEKYGIALEEITHDPNAKEIKGETAHKGKVRGKVCRVMGHNDFGKIKQGEILVSPMTMPDFLPEMKKASAIITDEGGMMCHAAIVAREMKIPCVVGTKNATELLKDGMEVEVDADNGIVKIIKKEVEPVGISSLTRLEKTYTRDTCLLIQEGWNNAIAHALKETMGAINPFIPPTAYYVSDGTVEVWENMTSTQWFIDTLLAKNKKDAAFLPKIIQSYEYALEKFNSIWKKGSISSLDAFKTYLDDVFNALYGFSIIYYSALDERTPPQLKKMALHIRDNDHFFDSTDKVLRYSLQRLFPRLEGNETVLLREELDRQPILPELQKRKKHFVLIPGIKQEAITIEEFAKKYPAYNFMLEKVNVNESQLKGQCAYAGKATGKVRIIRRKDQISKVKEGEIIVSPMTTPDYLPAMKKAGAIVTDEGGITCHAAIVARELGKPCVIGTKIATKVFKDGDLVEVDASKGIIRKLKVN